MFLGRRIYSRDNLPLEKIFCELYEIASGLPGVDPDRLRDLMLYDRIAKDNSCVIPRVLRRRDERLKQYSAICDKVFLRRTGVRRCVGVMYTERRVIFADYDVPDAVSGLYRVHSVSVDELLAFEEENSDRA